MKLRLDLLEHLADEDILKEVVANYHRCSAKTGVGYFKPATEQEKLAEAGRIEALAKCLEERRAAAAREAR